MARYIGSQCRLCRREGAKLFLKGIRCVTEKCAFTKRPFAPGKTGKTMTKKGSYYSMQLREKQKVKRLYGMLEAQFRRFYDIATSAKGVTGRTLMQLLERRLDNVVFRSLFALSRNQGRQFVRHGSAFIGGRRVDIPSYLVKEGDVIEFKVKDKMKALIKEHIELSAKERSVPTWLTVDKENLTITVNRLPEKEDIILPINEQLIIELYSK